MTTSKSYSATPDDIRAINRAFINRRHDAERYWKEAADLRREAGLRANTTVAGQLIAIAEHFEELAATVEKMRMRHANRRRAMLPAGRSRALDLVSAA